MISETYIKKIDSTINVLEQFEISLEKLLEKYEQQEMPDSKINRKVFFQTICEKKITKEQKSYMENKLKKLQHFRDRREPFEYGIDLILGWIIEDCILEILKKFKIEAELSGNDRYREFLHPKKISTQPDIKIKTKEKIEKPLEIMCSLQGTWNKKGHVDLRASKYNKLIDHKSLFLGIEPASSFGFFFDFDKDNDQNDWVKTHIPGYGGKEGFTNNNIKKHLITFKDILSIFENL